MNITLVSNDVELKSIIEKKQIFTEVDLTSSVTAENISNIKSSCIAISDEVISPKELSFVEVEQGKTVFYMMQNYHNSSIDSTLTAVCASKGIILVPNRLTVEQVAEFIIKTFTSEEDAGTKVITFFSTTPNIGTTTICLSVAQSLSKTTKSKIGVLLLNAWDKGTYQLNYKGKYLNELRGRLTNKAINSKEEFYLNFHMHTQDKLYILGGNNDIKLERQYTKEEIDYLIRLSKKYFDIVLIDAGSHFDNVNMLQALYHANMRYLVSNQQYKSTIHFKQAFDELLYPLGFKKTDFLMIINQLEDNSQLQTPRDISEDLDIMLLTSIFKVGNSWVTELNSTMLYDINELYRDSIDKIGKSIIGQYNLELEDGIVAVKHKRKWFKKGK